MPENTGRLSTTIADRYRIERNPCAGGTARVYLTADLEYERTVPIKVLPPDVSAIPGGERFRDEITVATVIDASVARA